MRKPRMFLGIIYCTILVAMFLSGCGARDPINGSAGTAPTQPVQNVKTVSKEDLERYVNTLYTLDAVFQNHHVKFQSSYSNEKEGFLEIRRIGDHSNPLSDEELAALKQSIYEAIGSEFPLNISVYTIGDHPGMTGKITAIEGERRFLVVASDKFLDNEKKMPDAVWYTMSDDAEIEFDGEPLNAKDVKIGSSVIVWSEGVMLTSYPGQTTGLRLEITEIDDGRGDAKGQITGVEKNGEGVNEERIIEVDGVKHRLLPITKIWLNGEHADDSDILVGDLVRVWFSGYEVGTESIVTQIVIER